MPPRGSKDRFAKDAARKKDKVPGPPPGLPAPGLPAPEEMTATSSSQPPDYPEFYPPGTTRKQKQDLRSYYRNRRYHGEDSSLHRIKGQAAYDPRPDICNRVGVPWNTPPRECQCKLWPLWLAKNLARRSDMVQQVTSLPCAENGTVTMSNPKCLYWRPGGSHMKKAWWYSGVPTAIFTVRRGRGGSRRDDKLNILELN